MFSELPDLKESYAPSHPTKPLPRYRKGLVINGTALDEIIGALITNDEAERLAQLGEQD